MYVRAHGWGGKEGKGKIDLVSVEDAVCGGTFMD